MNIGILTYHRSYNYGAFLQSIALCSRLNAESDIQAEIIDFNLNKAERRYSLETWNVKRRLRHFFSYKFKKQMHKSFAEGYELTKDMRSDEVLISDSLEKFCQFVFGKYDIIIAGSDEIWKIDNFRGFPSPYFLIGDLGCKKFSYAASARCSFDQLTSSDHVLLHDSLNDFDYISVRDQITFDAVKKELNPDKQIIISCDPVFLYDFKTASVNLNKYITQKINKNVLNQNKPIIIVMSENQALLKEIRQSLHNDYNLVSVFTHCFGYINLPNLNPFEWLTVIANSDFVITSFYHGTCFSIINNTPFISVATKAKKSKLVELLSGTEFENRLIEYDSHECRNWKLLINVFSVPYDSSAFVINKKSTFLHYLEELRNS